MKINKKQQKNLMIGGALIAVIVIAILIINPTFGLGAGVTLSCFYAPPAGPASTNVFDGSMVGLGDASCSDQFGTWQFEVTQATQNSVSIKALHNGATVGTHSITPGTSSTYTATDGSSAKVNVGASCVTRVNGEGPQIYGGSLSIDFYGPTGNYGWYNCGAPSATPTTQPTQTPAPTQTPNGCLYHNPDCPTGYMCQANTCFEIENPSAAPTATIFPLLTCESRGLVTCPIASTSNAICSQGVDDAGRCCATTTATCPIVNPTTTPTPAPSCKNSLNTVCSVDNNMIIILVIVLIVFIIALLRYFGYVKF